MKKYKLTLSIALLAVVWWLLVSLRQWTDPKLESDTGFSDAMIQKTETAESAEHRQENEGTVAIAQVLEPSKFVEDAATNYQELDKEVFELLELVRSKVKPIAEATLREWEVASVEYYNLPDKPRGDTLFVLLPRPNEELNQWITNTIIEEFDELDVGLESLDSETIRIMKELIGWPDADRALFAKARDNSRDTLILFENLDSDTVHKIRNLSSEEINPEMTLNSGLMKMNILNLENRNQYSHLLVVESDPGS